MQIQWTHMDEIDAAQRAAVEERLTKLAERRDDLIEVRIVGSRTQHHRHGGCEVRIHSLARGRELVASRERTDLTLALHDALDVFEQELRRLRDRRSEKPGAAAAPAPPHLGLIDRLFPDDGYGFVITDAGEQVYFHRNAVSGGLAFEGLTEGQRVGLNIEQGRDGPQATVITDVEPGTPSP